MSSADEFPVARDVDHVDTSANDVVETSPRSRERTRYVRECLARLGSSIANADELAIAARCGRARDVNPLADADGAGVADDRLPGSPRGEILTGQRVEGRVCSSGSASVGQTHGAPRAALQGTVHGAGVVDEVESSPRIAGEEFSREEIALEAITAATRGDEIAGDMNAALGQRYDVIDGRDVEVERGGAVHTPPAAITHHCTFDRALLVAAWGVGSDTLATARGSG